MSYQKERVRVALRATGEIEGFNGGDYHRFYLPTAISGDSQYPFDSGQGVRLQLVETVCGRQVLAITPETLEVDVDGSNVELQRSTAEKQLDLELQEATND